MPNRSPLSHVRDLAEVIISRSNLEYEGSGGTLEVDEGDKRDSAGVDNAEGGHAVDDSNYTLQDAWEQILEMLGSKSYQDDVLGGYHMSRILALTAKAIEAGFRSSFILKHPLIVQRVADCLCQVHYSLLSRTAAIDAAAQLLRALSEHVSSSTESIGNQINENTGNEKRSTHILNVIIQTSSWIVGRLIISYNLERKHGWNLELSCERVHLIYALGEAFMYCGDYIKELRLDLYKSSVFLLHEFVRNRKGKDECPFEDRAVFFVLNHRFEDNLLIGQVFMMTAKKKARTTESAEENDTMSVGFTNGGWRLFLPPDSWIPHPVGYTSLGYPFYSAADIVNSKGFHGLPIVELTPIRLDVQEERQAIISQYEDALDGAKKQLVESEEEQEKLRRQMELVAKRIEEKRKKYTAISGESDESPMSENAAELQREINQIVANQANLRNKMLDLDKRVNHRKEQLRKAQVRAEAAKESPSFTEAEVDEAEDAVASNKGKVEQLQEDLQKALSADDSLGVRAAATMLEQAQAELSDAQARAEALKDLHQIEVDHSKIEQDVVEEPDVETQELKEVIRETTPEEPVSIGTSESEESPAEDRQSDSESRSESDFADELGYELSEDEGSESEEDDDDGEGLIILADDIELDFHNTTFADRKSVRVSTSGTGQGVQIFITVTPRQVADVFQIVNDQAILTVDAGQTLEVPIEFNPLAHHTPSEEVKGEIQIQTFSGKLLASISVRGFRGPAFLFEKLDERTTWCREGDSATLWSCITNLSVTRREFRMSLAPKLCFTLIESVGILGPGEWKRLGIKFAPTDQGFYNSNVVVDCDGGESHNITVEGICGNPLVVRTVSPRIYFPESRIFSLSNIHRYKDNEINTETLQPLSTSQLRTRNYLKAYQGDIWSLSLEDGLRAVQAWHSNASRCLHGYKTDSGNLDDTEDSVVLSRVKHLEREIEESAKILKQIQEANSGYDAVNQQVSACTKILASTVKTYKESLQRRGKKPIDHSQRHKALEQKIEADEQFSQAQAEITKLSHLAVARSNLFLLEQNIEDVERLDVEMGDNHGSSSMQLQAAQENYMAAKSLVNAIGASTLLDYRWILSKQNNIAESDENEKTKTQRNAVHTTLLESGEEIHPGGVNDVGYEMAKRFSSHS